MIYRTNEFTFELPAGLKDKSVNIFSLTDDGPSEFGIVITRVPLNSNESLENYTSRQVAELKAKLPGFRCDTEAGTQVQGNPAIFLEFAWRTDAGFIHQRQVSWVMDTVGQLVVLTLTGTCRDKYSPEWSQVFQSVIDSIQIARKEAV
jgi:hypothetical protein